MLLLLGLSRFCIATNMFAEARVDHGFHTIMRKAASVLERVRGSTNSILHVIADRL